MLTLLLMTWVSGDSWQSERDITYSLIGQDYKTEEIYKIDSVFSNRRDGFFLRTSTILKASKVGDDLVPPSKGTEASVRLQRFNPSGTFVSGPLPNDPIEAAAERIERLIMGPTLKSSSTFSAIPTPVSTEKTKYVISLKVDAGDGFVVRGECLILNKSRLIEKMTLHASKVKVPGGYDLADVTIEQTLVKSSLDNRQ